MAGLYALVFWGAVVCIIVGLCVSLLVTVNSGKRFKVIMFFMIWVLATLCLMFTAYYYWLHSLHLTPFG